MFGGEALRFRAIVLFVLLSATQSSIAERSAKFFRIPCDVLSRSTGIDVLEKFERIPGFYRLDESESTWLDLSRYGWPRTLIPAYRYDPPITLDTPVTGLKFIDRSNYVEVQISAFLAKNRQELFRVTQSPVPEKYRNKSVFSFFEETLGVYVVPPDCEGRDKDKYVAMFMSSGILLPLGNSTSQVYRLTQPRALLIVSKESNERNYAQLVFPDEKNIDGLIVVLIGESKLHLPRTRGAFPPVQKIVSRLIKE